jgi:alpha-tubulin suppressor-like RCC1 family protein
LFALLLNIDCTAPPSELIVGRFSSRPASAELAGREKITTNGEVFVSGVNEHGHSHTCGLRRDGTVLCWGADEFGELGDGGRLGSSTTPVSLPFNNIVDISSGVHHTCAVDEDGTVLCWGFAKSPIHPIAISPARRVATAAVDSCALLVNGEVWCWPEDLSSPPAQMPGLAGVTAITGTFAHYCALIENSTQPVRCWGNNSRGELGDGTTNDSDLPVVANVTDVESVAAGVEFTCAIHSNRTVSCWGDNFYQNLGAAATGQQLSLVPVPIVGISNARRVAAGWGQVCVALDDSSSRCWGNSGSGELGDGTVDSSTPNPATPAFDVTRFGRHFIVPLRGVRQITAAGVGACALTFDDAFCWGDNVDGQIGDGTQTTRSRPTRTVGFR